MLNHIGLKKVDTVGGGFMNERNLVICRSSLVIDGGVKVGKLGCHEVKEILVTWNT